MPEKDFDTLLPQAKTNPIERRGYFWKVIVDLTRNEDDPGIICGKLFQTIDIQIAVSYRSDRNWR